MAVNSTNNSINNSINVPYAGIPNTTGGVIGMGGAAPTTTWQTSSYPWGDTVKSSSRTIRNANVEVYKILNIRTQKYLLDRNSKKDMLFFSETEANSYLLSILEELSGLIQEEITQNGFEITKVLESMTITVY